MWHRGPACRFCTLGHAVAAGAGKALGHWRGTRSALNTRDCSLPPPPWPYALLDDSLGSPGLLDVSASACHSQKRALAEATQLSLSNSPACLLRQPGNALRCSKGRTTQLPSPELFISLAVSPPRRPLHPLRQSSRQPPGPPLPHCRHPFHHGRGHLPKHRTIRTDSPTSVAREERGTL